VKRDGWASRFFPFSTTCYQPLDRTQSIARYASAAPSDRSCVLGVERSRLALSFCRGAANRNTRLIFSRFDELSKRARGGCSSTSSNELTARAQCWTSQEAPRLSGFLFLARVLIIGITFGDNVWVFASLVSFLTAAEMFSPQEHLSSPPHFFPTSHSFSLSTHLARSHSNLFEDRYQ